MKSNCKSLKLSIKLTILFMIFTIILSILTLNYDFEILEIILNISIGLFASTIVALLLNIPAYNVAKRQLLERF